MRRSSGLSLFRPDLPEDGAVGQARSRKTLNPEGLNRYKTPEQFGFRVWVVHGPQHLQITLTRAMHRMQSSQAFFSRPELWYSQIGGLFASTSLTSALALQVLKLLFAPGVSGWESGRDPEALKPRKPPGTGPKLSQLTIWGALGHLKF